tara:strand:- start:5403 stop:6374 length:972 start_codon:yes stop_codon:yes gene_type:complete
MTEHSNESPGPGHRRPAADLPDQTPRGGQIFLDHVGWFVPDMDAASDAFGRLGFPLTPYTVHMNEQPDGSRVPSGTANRCAMIRRGYLEILTRVPDVQSAITKQLDDGLARYTGLHLIAFTVADTEAATARLREAGFAPEAPIALRRPMPLDAGGEGTAAFSVIRLPSDAMAEGRVQVLSQDTPETVWQPSVTADENAIDMLSGLLICAEDPEEAAIRYERFTGRTAEPAGNGYRIDLDRGRISICPPAGCTGMLPGITVPGLPYIVAVSIRSADMTATRAFLAARGVPLLADEGDRIAVHPDAGMGAAFVFHAAGAEPFPAT